ncbi:tRNA (guanosine(46)-N7)-methyltransferase TrmB [Tumebacillus permanentifrigoris]|uniref:tRNA (guanine-N(7)-)-methyltransferase n=1 Tax=Tumebacillus permanentifrigoris TaxID=378543 RepID=A0A316DDA0_9BACL|nr:tRNA (guanosine(46)-N7)-methyltransferase TrmB [Tumebacillus permanentifrigoris]PWK13438.1 tRNA (guanine-N7-)-methyltransferase [Tumebacillus permanentifrigoris]
MRIRGRDKFLRQYNTYIEEGRIIPEAPKYKGRWRELFGNDNPIYIEIGTGRGQFISQHAVQNPEINYIGIELEYLLLGRVGHKAEVAGAGKNLIVTPADASRLTDFFEVGEVQRIYLNFSDPWPKNRHTPRRLTHSNFLKSYREVLDAHGEVHFKTDNRPLFEFSLNSFAEDDWKLSKITLDLHNSEWAEGNIMTEYEQKFSEQGVPINRLEARALPKRDL